MSQSQKGVLPNTIEKPIQKIDYDFEFFGDSGDTRI